MAIICAICGKKQSGWIEDFPLSNNHLDIRICANCYDHLKILQETLNDEIYSKEKSYFENILISNNVTDTVKLHINAMLQSLSEKREEERNKEVKEKEEQQKKIKEQQKKLQLINNHLLTTGYNFEGYFIKKYIKLVSGETVLGTGMLSEISASVSDIFGTESNAFSQKLVNARNSAMNKLIYESVECGGNAVIGVDFDYINFAGNMIGVIATGTSVYIEPLSYISKENSMITDSDSDKTI